MTAFGALNAAPPAEKKNELLDSMIWRGAIPIVKEEKGVLLQAEGTEVAKLETAEEYTPPFKVTAKVITDITETRIHYGKGIFIFNWANQPDQIRVHDFLTAGPTAFPNKGLKAGKEHTIVIDVDPKRVSMTVSGNRIYSSTGDFRALKNKLAIGPAMGAKIRLLSFVVEKQ
jgi:hypothetical protein